MNETLKRALAGTVYVAVMWIGTSYSEFTFHILFSSILGICWFEMRKLRQGKTKLLAYTYTTVPLILLQLYGMTDADIDGSHFDPSLVDSFLTILPSICAYNKMKA